MLPLPGRDLPGVMVYRDLDDVEAMLDSAKAFSSAVVIGGGLLGLEAAAGLHEQGMDVTVIHLATHLMERQLDSSAGHLLAESLKARGIKILTGVQTESIEGNDRVTGIKLDDGRYIKGDIVVMAVGIRPAVSLGEAAGLAVNRGILVDDQMKTSCADVFALGECVEHRETCYGLVAPLYEMAKVLAHTLLDQAAEYKGSTVSTKLKVSGIDLFSAGEFLGENDEEIVVRDASMGVYRRLILRDNRIVGVVMYGDTADSAWFLNLLKEKVDVSEQRSTLVFGQSYQGGTDVDPTAAVAALADSSEICGCNGVCKSVVVNSINAGSHDLESVRATTKASASCGSCTGLVEQLLTLTLGDQYKSAEVTPVCACTALGHADVRRLIAVSYTHLTLPTTPYV